MSDMNIHARFSVKEQPTTFKEWAKFAIGVMTGQRKVVKLVGSTGASEVFNAKIGKGKVAKSEKSFQEMMANHKLIPIPMKAIHSKAEANKLLPHEVIFVKVDNLAKLNLRMLDIQQAAKTPQTDLRLVQTTKAIEKALTTKLFFDNIKNTLVEKWSQPIDPKTLGKADILVKEYPSIKLTLQQSDTLTASRLEGSGTIKGFPKKIVGWYAAEDLIRSKAYKGKDLTLEDICTMNALINGNDDEELGGGVLRDHAMVLGGIGGAHYLGKDDVRSLMEELVNSISKSQSKGENPIVLAATTYQKMVSIHAFADGNGRTCRLVMDYLLMRAGLPPASLEGDEIIVAIFGDQGNEEFMPAKKTPDDAVKQVLEGVKRSYAKLDQ